MLSDPPTAPAVYHFPPASNTFFPWLPEHFSWFLSYFTRHLLSVWLDLPPRPNFERLEGPRAQSSDLSSTHSQQVGDLRHSQLYMPPSNCHTSIFNLLLARTHTSLIHLPTWHLHWDDYWNLAFSKPNLWFPHCNIRRNIHLVSAPGSWQKAPKTFVIS